MLAILASLDPAPAGAATKSFVHEATADDTAVFRTCLSHPLLDGHPDAIFVVTQTRTPGGVVNDHPVGVYYDALNGVHCIANEDQAEMPVGARFNVLIPGGELSGLLHVSAPGNFEGPVTLFSHPDFDSNPEIAVFAIHDLTPDDAILDFHDKNIGGIYSSALGQWGVFNEDETAMTEDLGFNVVGVPLFETPLYARTTRFGDGTGPTFPQLFLTGSEEGPADPSERWFVTHRYDWPYAGTSNIRHDETLAVGYDVLTAEEWHILNQSGADFPSGIVMSSVRAPLFADGFEVGDPSFWSAVSGP